MPEPIPIKDHEKENRLVNKRLLACALLVIGITCALVGRNPVSFMEIFDKDIMNATLESEQSQLRALKRGGY